MAPGEGFDYGCYFKTVSALINVGEAQSASRGSTLVLPDIASRGCSGAGAVWRGDDCGAKAGFAISAARDLESVDVAPKNPCRRNLGSCMRSGGLPDLSPVARSVAGDSRQSNCQSGGPLVRPENVDVLLHLRRSGQSANGAMKLGRGKSLPSLREVVGGSSSSCTVVPPVAVDFHQQSSLPFGQGVASSAEFPRARDHPQQHPCGLASELAAFSSSASDGWLLGEGRRAAHAMQHGGNLPEKKHCISEMFGPSAVETPKTMLTFQQLPSDAYPPSPRPLKDPCSIAQASTLPTFLPPDNHPKEQDWHSCDVSHQSSLPQSPHPGVGPPSPAAAAVPMDVGNPCPITAVDRGDLEASRHPHGSSNAIATVEAPLSDVAPNPVPRRKVLPYSQADADSGVFLSLPTFRNPSKLDGFQGTLYSAGSSKPAPPLFAPLAKSPLTASAPRKSANSKRAEEGCCGTDFDTTSPPCMGEIDANLPALGFQPSPLN